MIALPAPPPGRSGKANRRLLITGTVMLAALAGWSVVSPIDVVSSATGEVMPVTRVKTVQHLEGGIVSAILVVEGQHVDKGEPLLRLDPIRASSDHDELAAHLKALDIDIARLEAESHGDQDFTIPPELAQAVPQLATAAREAFATRHRRLAHDVSVQDNLVAQRQQELREIAIRVQNNRHALELVDDQVRMSKNLLDRELTSRMVHIDLERQQQTLKGQLDGDQAAIPRVDAALREAREHLGSIKETFYEQAGKELAAARQQRDELSQRMLKLQSVQDRTVLRAPVDGIVKSIAVATEGGVIQAGQTVMEIVPVEDRLVIEAKLPIQDIGYVRRGQEARVTLASADASAFGHIDGTVDTVSPDATVTSDGKAFYKIRIVTAANRFQLDDRIYQLYP